MEKNSEEDKDNPTITIIKMLFLAASCDPCSTSMVPKLPTLALCICFYFFLVKCLYLLLMKWFYHLILFCIFRFSIPCYVLVSFVHQVMLSFNPQVVFFFFVLSIFCVLYIFHHILRIRQGTGRFCQNNLKTQSTQPHFEILIWFTLPRQVWSYVEGKEGLKINKTMGDGAYCHHTCKKRENAEIYLRNFFWIFRKILGWEREINTAPKPSPEVAPSKMEVAPS